MPSVNPYSWVLYEGFLAEIPYPGYGEGFDPLWGGDEIPPSGTTPSSSSNVRNLDDSQGRLGCGVPQFFITSRCATSGVLCLLDANLISARWSRILDEVSEAEVVLYFGGDATYTCCECLAEAEPWCHELHIWRDGQEVWVGPIQEIEYQQDQVTVRAKDSLAWLSVRIPEGNINYTNEAGGAGPADLSDIAEDVIQVAFAEDDPTYTCELDNLYKVATGLVSQRFFEAFNQTALDVLLDIAATGLDFTVLGRTIVLTNDYTSLTPLIILNDEHIMGGLKVRKDGSLQGNRYYIHYEGDEGQPAIGEAADFYCYSAIERIRTGDGLVLQADAETVANEYVQASAIAPRIVELESNARLSPDTPWTINQMVPGARVDVAVTKLCLNLTQSFRLVGMEVNYSEQDGEAVGITLTPINDVAVI